MGLLIEYAGAANAHWCNTLTLVTGLPLFVQFCKVYGHWAMI